MKIRAKRGYNIIINDINIILSSENDTFVEVDDETWNNSKDKNSIMQFIEFDDGKQNKKVSKVDKTVVKQQNDNFVVDVKNKPEHKSDVLIADPNNELGGSNSIIELKQEAVTMGEVSPDGIKRNAEKEAPAEEQKTETVVETVIEETDKETAEAVESAAEQDNNESTEGKKPGRGRKKKNK